MLQLYKVKLDSLQNRPVELIIKSSNPEDESTVELDI